MFSSNVSLLGQMLGHLPQFYFALLCFVFLCFLRVASMKIVRCYRGQIKNVYMKQNIQNLKLNSAQNRVHCVFSCERDFL